MSSLFQVRLLPSQPNMELFEVWLSYTLITVGLFALIIVYFRVALQFNIVDMPNFRSSHSEVTIRGGGIIFSFAFLLYALLYHTISNILLIGFLAISVVSFIDDIKNLHIRYRFVVHLFAVSTLIYSLGGFHTWVSLVVPVVYILILGAINAYNFMDGINGITGLYSLVIFCTLLFVNHLQPFTDAGFIGIGALSCVVFLFFNFRKRARCFAGDVGSVSLAFWVICLLGMLIVKTGEYKYLLFLAVYGTDSALTIIHRLYLRQKIFEAHRLHFYQILANENKMPHLWVSVLYATVQLSINLLVIFSKLDFLTLFLLVNVPLWLVYCLAKPKLMKDKV